MNNTSKFLDIHPAYISGFTQADGSFFISVERNKNMKLGLRITPRFVLSQRISEFLLLEKIKKHFNVGHLTKSREEVQFVVNSLPQLNDVIIVHFDKYPPRSGKLEAFLKFKQVILMMNNGLHLNREGLSQIIEIIFSMNKSSFRTSEKKEELLNFIGSNSLVLVDQPIFPLLPIIDPNFFMGLIDGDGSFFVSFTKERKIKVGFTVIQDSSSREMLFELIKFFDCGYVYDLPTNAFRFQISSLDKIISNVIPKIKVYSFHTKKKIHFLLFDKICQLLKNNHQKTSEGFLEIVELSYEMNNEGKGRKLSKVDYVRKIIENQI